MNVEISCNLLWFINVYGAKSVNQGILFGSDMKTNKILFFIFAALSSLSFFASRTFADENKSKDYNTYNNNGRAGMADVTGMQVDIDGVLEKNEFEFISTNESITRSWCPYDCNARSIPRKNCRAWRSIQDPTKCYVQDLRLPSSAINFR